MEVLNHMNFDAFLEFLRTHKHVLWLLEIVTGLIGVSVGVALMYLLPPYIIGILNNTGLFTAAAVTSANNAVTTILAIGFLITIIGLFWVVLGIVSFVRTAGKGGK